MAIPVHQKYLLTISEASEYFSIGVRRLREFAGAHPDLGLNAVSILMDFLGRINFANEELNEFIAFYNDNIGFVTPSDLLERYRKVMDYPHICKKCSGKMRIIRAEDQETLNCPICRKPLESEGRILWD